MSTFRPTAVLLLPLTVLLLLGSGGMPGHTYAQWIPGTPQFQPTFDIKLCNDLSPGFSGPAPLPGAGGACTPDTTPSGNPDVTITFNIPYGHMSYDQGYYVTSLADFTVAADAAIPDGTAAGGVERTTATFGLMATPCDNTIPPDFIWWDSTTDNITSVIGVSPEGTPDRFATMAIDGGDAYFGQANANSPIVTGYPHTLNRFFDPDGSGDATGGFSPVTPHARYAGLTQVPPGGDWQMLQAVVFAPGDLQAAFSSNPNTLNHPFAKLISDLGYTTVVVRNDPTARIIHAEPISDFCSPLNSQEMLLGMVDTTGNGVGDTPRLTSPASTSHMAQVRTQSLRDADGDGIENNFDTCAWTANTDDPYTTNGVDTDMLDPACDPDPGIKNDDEDGDGYLNSQDLCPQVANPLPGGETDSEEAVTYKAAAPDGGPQGDAIGNDCDSEQGGSDYVSDGLYFNAIHVDSVTITGGGVVDNDGDGWGSDVDPNDGDANDPGQMTHVMIDAVGNPTLDSDGDGYSNLMEWTYIGTDPVSFCPLFSGEHDAWPPDMNHDTLVNLLDVMHYLPPNPGVGLLYTDPGWTPEVQRLDLNGDGAVSLVSDLEYNLMWYWGATCVGGPTGPPLWSPGGDVIMGIDPETSGNSANTLGTLESCMRVDVAPANLGDGVADHTIDVYVTGDTEDPTGYDAWMDYDPNSVDPVSWDDLIKLPGAVSVTQKKTSRLNAGAFYSMGGPGTDGDGTITRIDLDAISGGPACLAFGFAKAFSSLNESHLTFPQAAMLAINEDCPTQDSDGDGILDVCDSCLSDVNPGQEDLDGDGVGDTCDNCMDTANAGQYDADGDTFGDACDNCPLDYNLSQDDVDGDGWGDVCDNCPVVATAWQVPPGDSDCDGWTDANEGTIGTDTADNCPDDPADDAWPCDFDMNTFINLGDVFNVLPPYFGSSPGIPDTNGDTVPDWSVRRDLQPNGFINLGDVFMVLPPYFGSMCTP